jgi:uncharacterized membrane protein YfcA
MSRILAFFIESIFWLQIFLCPVIISAGIGFLIISNWQDLLPLAAFILLIGIVAGILIAERIRKKYGCSRYLSRIISTPDIWPIDDEPRSGKG